TGTETFQGRNISAALARPRPRRADDHATRAAILLRSLGNCIVTWLASGQDSAGVQAGVLAGLHCGPHQLGAAAQARFSWRARVRMAVSRSVSTCLAIVVSAHCPVGERSWRSTVTVIESDRNARARMKTL